MAGANLLLNYFFLCMDAGKFSGVLYKLGEHNDSASGNVGS